MTSLWRQCEPLIIFRPPLQNVLERSVSMENDMNESLIGGEGEGAGVVTNALMSSRSGPLTCQK